MCRSEVAIVTMLSGVRATMRRARACKTRSRAMRVNYEVDRDGSMVRAELSGTALSGEFRAFAEAIGNHGGFERGMSVLIDARRLRQLPRSEDIIPLACHYRSLRSGGMVGCTAIVLDTDAGFGAARLFQIQAG